MTVNQVAPLKIKIKAMAELTFEQFEKMTLKEKKHHYAEYCALRERTKNLEKQLAKESKQELVKTGCK